MTDEEIKYQLIHIINECEGIAQWVGEVCGDDITLDGLLDALYDEAVNMSRIAVKTQLTIAKHHGKSGNKGNKEDEE